MTESNRRIGIAAIAAVLAGCGGSLATPDGPTADAGATTDARLGGYSVQDALHQVDAPSYDVRGMAPCPDKIAERVDGTACQFSIPDVAECTGLGIRVHVRIDGAEVPMLPDDGWTFTDATETVVELHGAACVQADQSPTGVTIYFTFYLV